MKKEKYENSELEIIRFRSDDVITTSVKDEYEGWNPHEQNSGGSEYEGWNPH